MTNTEAAWLAGLLEGEGYFQITKPRHHHPTQVVIRLSMTDKDVVEKAANLLKVSINSKAETSEKKTIYSFTLSRRDDVEKTLIQILPHMGSRRSKKINKCIDHCHITNKVRGVLCNNCNTALGLVKDNRQTLLNMLQYLDT